MVAHRCLLETFLLAALLLITGGCLGNSLAPEDRVVRTITPIEASTLIEERGGDPGFVIIDVRRPDEFAGGHIPGAINIDSAHLSEHLGDLDREATCLIYCQRGGRSAGVREVMRDAGFREIYDIGGGLSAWKAAGLPVTVV